LILIFSVVVIAGEQEPKEPEFNVNIEFFAGDVNNSVRNISIPIDDDSLFEVAAQFFVLLTPGFDDKVEVQQPTQVTVTILDNDRK
jgi:hypothetical protein